MLDENAFSLDSFDDRSWLFLLDVPATQTWNAWGKSWGKSWGVAWGPLLEAPYFDLSGRQQVQIRSALASVYAETEVDQVFVVAAQNNLCVLDAITALRINTEPLQLFVRNERKSKVDKPVRQEKPIKPRPERKNLPAYVFADEKQLFTRADVAAAFVATQAQSIVASTGGTTIFTKE